MPFTLSGFTLSVIPECTYRGSSIAAGFPTKSLGNDDQNGAPFSHAAGFSERH